MKLLDGDLLRIARLGMGWSLKDLSERCQISVSYLSHVEKNRRKIPDAVKAVLDIEKETRWLIHLIFFLGNTPNLIPDRKEEILEKLKTILKLTF